ncbi:MAG: 2-C-methyl-D-erythritol 2,4-cyclodiphosphate synthase [Kiritimatiellia bacterium]|nr:2-C-methyl-D-erythritol 2,4-cyclodiphosphate synthase [Kiritimatiellia bacterium]
MNFRTGTGFDAHRLVPNRPLVLGGVRIPHALGLLGHSDADVLVHALMDALLGAAALGDIGLHFPDTDPAYEGADSMRLLEQVAHLLSDRHYAIANIDATVIAEIPKLRPHIEAMRANLARALQIPPDTVSVKATTVEGMGALGRKEGIAALATVLIFRT